MAGRAAMISEGVFYGGIAVATIGGVGALITSGFTADRLIRSHKGEVPNNATKALAGSSVGLLVVTLVGGLMVVGAVGGRRATA